jgi:hypothetical protein
MKLHNEYYKIYNSLLHIDQKLLYPYKDVIKFFLFQNEKLSWLSNNNNKTELKRI